MTSIKAYNIATKPNTRKRKIEIKKVEQLNKRRVTFSKRKLGLFNKVIELSILCQAKTVLIITSPNGKFYVCGYPTLDTVIRQFLAGENPHDSEKRNQQQQQQQQEGTVETLRLQYEAIQDRLKENKKNLQVITDALKSSSNFPLWWNLSIEDMSLECLEQFKTSMEHLKLNLATAVEEKRINSLPPSVVTDTVNDQLQPLFDDEILEIIKGILDDEPVLDLRHVNSYADHFPQICDLRYF